MATNNNNASIHCKTSYNGQIRRFALDCTEFTSLKETIAKLFSLNDEFVLKYRDDESDYVTLDSQEELITALNYSPNVLRILVETKTALSTISSDEFSNKCHKRRHCERRMSHHGKDHHGHHDWKERHHGLYGGQPGCADHHHPHHGLYGGHPGWKEHHSRPHGHQGGHSGRKDHHHRHHEFKDSNMKSTEHRKLRREKKIAFINQCLADFGTDDSTLTPRALFRKQKLLRKKQRIESCLKGECFNQRKKQGITTPEEEQFNQNIKNQILAVKIEAMKVKARKREIKMMLQDKGDDKGLRNELSALHEQMKLFHNQKKALIDQLHI